MRPRRTVWMRTTGLIGSVIFLASLLASEAAAQRCSKDAECVVGGKHGTRTCAAGTLGQCVPDPDLGDDALCGGKACKSDKVCQDRECVASCKDGFTNCGGFCRRLSTDSANCGACNHVCPTGMTCQQSQGPVVFGLGPGGGQSLPVGSVCACAPPTVGCNGVCRDISNDASNCGQCGN